MQEEKMNSKIKNYVDVLFKGIPNTKKARELKEEILSNLNDHFEAHIAEGKSENQAYTDSLADLGDIDELLKTLEPELELKEKIDTYRRFRAKNTSLSICLFFCGIVCVIGFGGISAFLAPEKVALFGAMGVIAMFICIAAGVGLLVYTHMSMPQDVSQYIMTKNRFMPAEYTGSNKNLKKLTAFMQLYWSIILIIYLGLSFYTGRWGITWIIWLIAVAVKNALYVLFDTTDEEMDKINND